MCNFATILILYIFSPLFICKQSYFNWLQLQQDDFDVNFNVTLSGKARWMPMLVLRLLLLLLAGFTLFSDERE